jgi:hypothetical protein
LVILVSEPVLFDFIEVDAVRLQFRNGGTGAAVSLFEFKVEAGMSVGFSSAQAAQEVLLNLSLSERVLVLSLRDKVVQLHSPANFEEKRARGLFVSLPQVRQPALLDGGCVSRSKGLHERFSNLLPGRVLVKGLQHCPGIRVG